MDRRAFLGRGARLAGAGLGAWVAPWSSGRAWAQEIRWARRFDALPAAVRGNVVVTGVGDIVLTESVYLSLPEESRVLLGLLSTRGDLVLGNLAGTLSDGGNAARKDVVVAPTAVVHDLRASGLSVLNLANEHLLDVRDGVGLRETLAALEGVGIATVGGGRNVEEAMARAVREVRGARVAFLGFHTSTDWEGLDGSAAAGPSTPGTAAVRAEWLRTGLDRSESMVVPLGPDLERMEAAVGRAGRDAEYVVVALNTRWSLPGDDSGAVPSGLRMLARTAVEAGAHLVLGSGFHRILPVERWEGGVIVYDAGNFFFQLFDGEAPSGAFALFPETREKVRGYLEDPRHFESVAVRAVLAAGGVERVDFVPFVHGTDGRPRLTGDAEAGAILGKLAAASEREFGTTMRVEEWHAWM